VAQFFGKYTGIFGGGGGAGTSATPYQEIPVGLINNVNTVYTVTTAPSPIEAFRLFLDGLIQIQNVNYTIVGTTITMTTAPNFGQELYAVFSVDGGAGASGVTSLNAATGAVTVVAGAGISVGTVGPVITITNTGVSPLVVDGNRAAPQLITAAGGLAFAGTQAFTKKYIAGNGGPIVVTANPQIAAGVSDGQQMTIQGTNAVDTVQLSDGNGLALNGAWVGGLNSIITLSWDLVNWVEVSRQ